MATQTAASCSYADVNTAMGLCNDGDTLAIPAGTAEWADTLTVTKAITIQGAGKAATILTPHNTTHQYMIFNPGSDKAQRLTGVGFVGGGDSGSEGSYGKIHVISGNEGAYCLTQFRIDHCDFQGHWEAIWFSGWIEGLIDHNSFTNCNRTLLIAGDGDASWERAIAAGTADALFIEDNEFVYTNDHTVSNDQFIYHYGGARTVIRYNDFDTTAQTERFGYIIDSHGNFPYVGPAASTRGQPIIEIYNNTISFYDGSAVIQLRGGSVLLYNNTLICTHNLGNWCELWEEESWAGVGYPLWGVARTVWPAQDQIANTFIWNNTMNGGPTGAIAFNQPEDPTFIQEDRDYFLHAPASSGGKTSYTGAKKGGSDTYPTDGAYNFPPVYTDTGDTAFSAVGANAYYPYTAYTYPHPMQGVNPGDGWLQRWLLLGMFDDEGESV